MYHRLSQMKPSVFPFLVAHPCIQPGNTSTHCYEDYHTSLRQILEGRAIWLFMLPADESRHRSYEHSLLKNNTAKRSCQLYRDSQARTDALTYTVIFILAASILAHTCL